MVEQRKDCYSHSSSSVELCAQGGTLFSWGGVLTFGGIDAIVGEVSALLAAQGVGVVLRNRVRHILIELLENAYRYGHTHGGEAAPWIGMQVGVGEHGSILLEVANRVLPAQRAFLEGYLSRLQQMDMQECNHTIRARLAGGEVSMKGGAGLGLLSCVRSCRGFEWTFTRDELGYCLFTFRAHVEERNATASAWGSELGT